MASISNFKQIRQRIYYLETIGKFKQNLYRNYSKKMLKKVFTAYIDPPLNMKTMDMYDSLI